MRECLYERATNEAVFIIESHATVRAAAKKFGVSKSSIHMDITKRLPEYNHTLYNEVRKVLNTNLADRARRGGQATKIKYRKQSANGNVCSRSA